jgi:exodeoxyribonuclease V alpha subunit
MLTSAPSSLEGIEKYLASGMIRGIGPVYGKKMVQVFGEKVFDIIEGTSERLRACSRHPWWRFSGLMRLVE